MFVFGNSDAFLNTIMNLRCNGHIEEYNKAARLYNDNITLFISCNPDIYMDLLESKHTDILFLDMLS